MEYNRDKTIEVRQGGCGVRGSLLKELGMYWATSYGLGPEGWKFVLC